MIHTEGKLQPLIAEIIKHKIPAQVAFQKIQQNEWEVHKINHTWLVNTEISPTKQQEIGDTSQSALIPNQAHLQTLLKQAHPLLQREFLRMQNELQEAQMIISLYEDPKTPQFLREQ